MRPSKKARAITHTLLRRPRSAQCRRPRPEIHLQRPTAPCISRMGWATFPFCKYGGRLCRKLTCSGNSSATARLPLRAISAGSAATAEVVAVLRAAGRALGISISPRKGEIRRGAAASGEMALAMRRLTAADHAGGPDSAWGPSHARIGGPPSGGGSRWSASASRAVLALSSAVLKTTGSRAAGSGLRRFIIAVVSGMAIFAPLLLQIEVARLATTIQSTREEN